MSLSQSQTIMIISGMDCMPTWVFYETFHPRQNFVSLEYWNWTLVCSNKEDGNCSKIVAHAKFRKTTIKEGVLDGQNGMKEEEKGGRFWRH